MTRSHPPAGAGPPLPPASASALDAIVEHALCEAPYPGLAVMVERDGSPIYIAERGLADLENEVPITRQTVFAIGSVSKTFTALSLLQLVADGKLPLEAAIGRYLPDLPEPFRAVPVKSLLCHTSGIPEYTSVASVPMTSQQDVAPSEVLSFLQHSPARFPVGSRFDYSNTNTYLAGLLIEELSGMSYRDYLNAHVMRPFGMHHTFYADYRDIIPGRARGYTFDRRTNHFQGAAQYSAAVVYAAGALQSTLDDLLRYGRGLTSATSERVGRLMLETNRLEDGTRNYYALGCLIARDFAGHRKLSHPGNVYGFSAEFATYPDDGLTIIVLGNSDNPRIPPSSIERQLARVVLGVGGSLGEAKALPPSLESFAGVYQFTPFRFFADSLEFTVKDDRLWFQEHGVWGEELPPAPLRYWGDDRFSVEYDIERSFEFSRTGQHAERVRAEYDGMYFDAHYIPSGSHRTPFGIDLP